MTTSNVCYPSTTKSLLKSFFSFKAVALLALLFVFAGSALAWNTCGCSMTYPNYRTHGMDASELAYTNAVLSAVSSSVLSSGSL
ncbi:hypothetical protein JNK13_10315, partial [bacterium]|nr:hypothetical protein [bacterium]